jgi:S-formylglutathione hydrolase FrmB
MPTHVFDPPKGRIERLRIDSTALAANLLGDPSTRTVDVYLPPGYDDASTAYPLFVALAGFTGSGLKMHAWQGFGENVPQRVDRLVESGEMGPVVLAFPDGFTSLGGNQYINSKATGLWEDFVLDEMIPAIESRFRVVKDPGSRAIFGKSSGGYGALIHGLKHAESWGAIACHSGDMGFETAYLRDYPKALETLARYDGDPAGFVRDVHAAERISGDQMWALLLLAMAASYDPDPSKPFGIRLPVDPHTGERIEERWSCWLAHDPLCLIEREECRAALASLRGVFIDCGSRDQYFLQYPARVFTRRLGELDIDHTYEEFDGTHSGIDHRMDRSLPFLYKAVTSG